MIAAPRPDAATLHAVAEATWPALSRTVAGPWTLRDGAGGGKRVSAATCDGVWTGDDLPAAETAMQMLGQSPLFMIRQGDEALDGALAARGYELLDPVTLWLCPVTRLTDKTIPRVTAFTIWEPLAIMRDIWAAGGIGPARLAVMERAAPPKTGIFGRTGDKPAGTGFCAIHETVAMVHALEVTPESRGKGLGRWMMRAAAIWAEREGADWMAVLCTDANDAANGLYASLGMTAVGRYHYRKSPNPEGD